MLSFPKSSFYSCGAAQFPCSKSYCCGIMELKKKKKILLLVKHQLCGNGCHQRRARAIFILFYSSQITVVLPNRGPAVQEGLRCSQQVEVSVMNLLLKKYRGQGACIWLWGSRHGQESHEECEILYRERWTNSEGALQPVCSPGQKSLKGLGSTCFQRGGGTGHIKDEMGERADYFMNKILQYLQWW